MTMETAMRLACGAVPQHVHVGDCHVPAGMFLQLRKIHILLILKSIMKTYV